jgi:hypothetical protein
MIHNIERAFLLCLQVCLLISIRVSNDFVNKNFASL